MGMGRSYGNKDSLADDPKKIVLPNEQVFEQVRQFLAEGKSVIFSPKGNSMLPFIRGERDSVELAPVEKPLEVGDIALFSTGGRFFLHRLFAIDGERLTFMGDGNSRGKEHCKEGDVIGVVTRIIKKNGRELRPGKGKFWRMLLPFRRYMMAVLTRTFYYEDRKRLYSKETVG